MTATGAYNGGFSPTLRRHRRRDHPRPGHPPQKHGGERRRGPPCGTRRHEIAAAPGLGMPWYGQAKKNFAELQEQR